MPLRARIVQGKHREGRRLALPVTVCRVSPGRSRSGSDVAHLSLSRDAPSARSSSVNSCVTLTPFVQLVLMRN